MREPLAHSIDLLQVALTGDLDRLAHELHLLATEAIDDANSAEEAVDTLADVMKTLTVVAAEATRSLAGAVVAALGAAGPGAVIAIELGSVPVDATAERDATELATALIRSARS